MIRNWKREPEALYRHSYLIRPIRCIRPIRVLIWLLPFQVRELHPGIPQQNSLQKDGEVVIPSSKVRLGVSAGWNCFSQAPLP